MTVAEYVFDFMVKKGCKTVFMVSGSSAMWLTDALKRNERLNAVCCHHEQAAAMAADGYGRVNQIPGACLVTIGPGAMNAITGVAQAYLDSSPMFVFSGQANSKFLRTEEMTGIRQLGTQSLNLRPIVGTITKYFAAVMKPESIKYHMEKAYREAMSGRKGPVWIDIPIDIQNSQIPDIMEGYSEAEEDLHSIQNEQVKKSVEALLKSKKPLILAGYGIRSAQAEGLLRELCVQYRIPVVTSRGGIDVIETDNLMFIGRPGSYGDRASHFAIQQCDFLLILGSRLATSTIGYYPQKLAPKAFKIMVDTDYLELDKGEVPLDYKICGDVKEYLTKILGALCEIRIPDYEQWVQYCNSMKNQYPTVLPEYAEEEGINAYWFTNVLTEEAEENTNILVDTGSVCNIVSQSWKIKKGQRYLISGGLSCMGFWATAIGTYQAGRKIIAITGDGSAQMNIQELATLKYNKLPIKLFIYNNNGYMLIRHNQHNYMDDRFLGVGPDSGLETPDFVKVAKAYGIEAFQIQDKQSVRETVRKVLEYEGPVVCQVTVQEFAPIIPRIASKLMADGTLRAAEFDDLYPFLDN